MQASFFVPLLLLACSSLHIKKEKEKRRRINP